MASPVHQVPVNLPLIDIKTGKALPALSNWLVMAYQRIGGQSADTNLELANQTAQISILSQDIAALAVVINQQSASISSLQSQIYEIESGPLP
jgi:hypothetical protein